MNGRSADAERRLRLSRSAEAAFRDLPPVARREVASALDLLEREGWSAPAAADPRDPRIRVVTSASGHRIRVLRQPAPSGGDSVLLVLGIEGSPAPMDRRRSVLGPLWGDLGGDLRVAARSLVRAPAFTAAVLITLTVGLGGTTTILGLANTVYRGALPFEDGDRLVRLRNFALAEGGERVYNLSPRDFHAIRDDNRVFSGVVAQEGGSLALLGDDGATRVSAISVSEGWGRVLGVRPQVGRSFSPEEHASGPEARVVLISDGLWARHFGSRPDIVGRSLDTAEGRWTVIGVLPARFSYPYDADVWLPGRFDATVWQTHGLNAVARLGTGVGLDGARADMARVYGALREASPGTTPDDGIHVATARDDFIRDGADSLRGLSAAVVVLLLLAFANVATLFTVRMVSRGHEVSIRTALGAGSLRIARLAVLESVLLFGTGAMAGLAVTWALGGVAAALVPDVLATQLALDRVLIDPALVGGVLAVAVLAGLVTGGVAVVRSARAGLAPDLRESGRSGQGRRQGALQDLLVVAEVALALVLLIGAGVLLDHVRTLARADLGYDTDGVVTIQVATEADRYGTPDGRSRLVSELESAIGALPSVSAVGVTSVNPLCCGDWGASIRIEGLERPEDAPPLLIHHRAVTAGFFEAMRIPVLRGRPFGSEDVPEAPPVVIVDERLANRFWPGEDPIGMRLGLARPGANLRTVVGVVPTVHREGDYTEGWYLPISQVPLDRSTGILHVMARARTDDALAGIRLAIAELDPTLAQFGATTLASHRRERSTQERIGAAVAVAFAAVGMLLACVGVYGLLAYRVTLRRRELGTRMALGANAGGIVRLVVFRSARMLAGGITLGVALGYGLNWALRRVVPEVAVAPLALSGSLALLLAAAVLAAALGPATRAARIDPADVMRQG